MNFFFFLKQEKVVGQFHDGCAFVLFSLGMTMTMGTEKVSGYDQH